MRISHELSQLTVWCLCIFLITRIDSFLFRREKAFHQLLNDPFQVQEERITPQNIFKWLNLKNHIKFKLWTRRNPRWAQEIVIDDIESLRSSNYDTKKLTKVLVHGWAHSANEVSMEDWILALRDAYLRLADLNIIFIDYTMFALPIMYFSAAPELAAQRLAELIQFLVKKGGADWNHFHLLGYSWGAHVAGMAGQRLNGSLSRITGLDPANPTFRLVGNSLRLDKADAKFVDILHSGGGPFIQGYLGLELPLGHVDFYPNGGSTQPGCAFHWSKMDEGIECDHGRSVWYFVESINSPYAFPSCKCSSWSAFVRGQCPCPLEASTLMGEFTPHTTEGIYYLFTRGESPFGLGPHMNLTLPTMEEYDGEWDKYDHMKHNFTSSSAKEFLTKIVQKSMKRLPPPYLAVYGQEHLEIRRTTVSFRETLLDKLKRSLREPLENQTDTLSMLQYPSRGITNGTF